jgi:Fe2+ or Zn2+ uptake regulation protein
VSAISWIACPTDWRHPVNHQDYVCLQCGAEAIEMDADEVKQIFNEATKPENVTPNDDPSA